MLTYAIHIIRLIEETLSPIAYVTEWTSIGLQNVWFLLSVNISSKPCTINDYFKITYSSSMNIWLGKYSEPFNGLLCLVYFEIKLEQ